MISSWIYQAEQKADLYPYAAGKKTETDLENHTGIICWVNVRDCKAHHVMNDAEDM